MTSWQDIGTCPRNDRVLLFAEQVPSGNTDEPRWFGPMVLSGYYDPIDEAWCSEGSTWTGPFFKPTHWMPLPSPPSKEGE